MELPLRLERTLAFADQADAFLLPSTDTRALAVACSWLGGKVLPRIFPVGGGFLLIAPEPTARALPGSIKLHRRAGDFYIPLGARLAPALLPEEMVALTARQGLIVLPGDSILTFDPHNPLPVSEWLAVPTVDKGQWRAFPPRPERPQRLTTITRPVPPGAVAELLEAGAPEDTHRLSDPGRGTGAGLPEEARPPSGSFFRRAFASARLDLARMLAWLARQFNAPGLARAAGELARRAVESIPRLTERILGEQEAALREVLRQLQSGEIEKALKRAPAALADPEQPVRVAGNADLGHRDPRYSLKSLISGGSNASVWLGGGDVWSELAKEYRRLASEAASRGDFRRAAYLYGVLLRDLRAAANALVAGGIFRDAAIIFRDRLKDLPAAADAFERAGDHDEALRIYDQLSQFERAAELLRSLGEIERANEYFIRSAQAKAASGLWLEAGDQVRTRIGNLTIAMNLYRSGWEAKVSCSVNCGERLLDMHLTSGDHAATRALLGEAEAALANQPLDAGRFFNYALGVSEGFLPEDERSDLQDRVRLLFAEHLRLSAETPAQANHHGTQLFGNASNWSPAVARDAIHAMRTRRSLSSRPENRSYNEPLRIAREDVTAVAVARGSFDVIVATYAEVVRWSPASGQIAPVCELKHAGVASAIGADRQAKLIYVLSQTDTGTALDCFDSDRSGRFSRAGTLGMDEPHSNGQCYLQDTASFVDGDYYVTLSAPDVRITLRGGNLISVPERRFLDHGEPTHLLAEGAGGWRWDWKGREVRFLEPGQAWDMNSLQSDWLPRQAMKGATVLRSSVDWLTPGPGHLELAGLDDNLALYWSAFDCSQRGSHLSRTAVARETANYVTVCLSAPGSLIAATADNEVHWLRRNGPNLERWAQTSVRVPARIVALLSPQLNAEVLAILKDGTAVRIRQPN